MRPEPNRIKSVQSDCLFFKVEQGIMESTLADMIVLFVTKCGAVPITSPSQEELSKAQVKKKEKRKKFLCVFNIALCYCSCCFTRRSCLLNNKLACFFIFFIKKGKIWLKH